MNRFVLGAVTQLIAILLLIPGLSSAGTISGTVQVRGLRTSENILVYLDKIDLAATASHPFVMGQKNLTFSPHILRVPVGGTVRFPNNDKVDHNVFSLSRSNPFNLGTYHPGEYREVTFNKPGIVELRCDVHAEMIAYIMVVKNPFVTKTDKKGHFRLPDSSWLKSAGIQGESDIPAGSYKLRIWHEKLRPVSKKIVVPEKGNVEVKLKARRGPAGSVLYK